MQKISSRNIILVLLAVLILFIIALFIGKVTYSFMAPDVDPETFNAGEVTATGDTLIFSKGKSLNLVASSDNFNASKGNLTDTTNPAVKLVASSKTDEANATYYAGVVISENTYNYSTTDKRAELILTIKDEKGNLITTSSDDLPYVEDASGVKGFDITGKTGAFNIVIDHPITTKSSTQGTIHTWTFTLTFINMSGVDQSINENASLKMNAVLAKDKILQTKYWNDDFSSTTYAFPDMPSTTYASLAELQAGYADFASKPYYIKTTTTEHQACLYYNNREFCLGPNYWVGDSQDETDGATTKAKLKADMENALGVTIADSSCSSDSSYASCDVSSFYCSAYSDGSVGCFDVSSGCCVIGDGAALCSW